MINGFYFKWALNFNIVTRRKGLWLIRPMVGVQISNQSALHLMRILPHSSFCISTRIYPIRSVDGQHPERHKGILACRVCIWLCLRFSDHLKMNYWKCNMSMVMVEYIYGISNIRDSCYELDMRILYKDSHKNIDLVYYCFCRLDELPASWAWISGQDLHVVYCLHTRTITCWAQYTRWLLLIETQWTVCSTTLSLGLDQHTYDLFKIFFEPWLSENLQLYIYRVTLWLMTN